MPWGHPEACLLVLGDVVLTFRSVEMPQPTVKTSQPQGVRWCKLEEHHSGTSHGRQIERERERASKDRAPLKTVLRLVDTRAEAVVLCSSAI